MAIENFRTLSYLVKSRPSAKTAVSSLSLSLCLAIKFFGVKEGRA